MARVASTPVLALLCWLALWRPGSGFDFEACTAPCWDVYNRCRANEQLASCNPPMKVCMDHCVQLKDAVSLGARLSDTGRRDSTGGQDKVKDDFRDQDDWGPPQLFHL